MKSYDCNVIKINLQDVANGPGIRVSVWVSGCTHNCPGCHNPDTWKWKQGHQLTEKLIFDIIKQCDKPRVSGLTLSGGDPLFVKNIDGLTDLCRHFKVYFGNQKDIWLWTGSSWEDIKDLELFSKNLVDVVVDGEYKQDLKDVSLVYSGSTNQRVIDVKKSNQQGTIVLYQPTETKRPYIPIV